MRLAVRRQRGAVTVLAAVAVIAMLTATMLAVEVGRVYSAHRQLQKAAMLAALDASRIVSGCSATATPANFSSAISTSLASNGYAAGALTSTVSEFGTIQTSAANLRSLSPTASITDANAARVTLTAPFPTPLIPLLPTVAGSMKVSATAAQSALGSLSVGSGLLSLNNGLLNSLLSALLGGNVTLKALDYTGLVGVNVTVGQLATALGVQVKDLSNPLALSAQTPVSILNGLADALSGTASKQVTDSIKDLAGQTTNNTPIPLGRILRPVGELASNAPFANLGDLIAALALATQADPTGAATPLELKNLSFSMAGVTLKAYLRVLQAPQFSGLGRPGQTSASSAQIRLMTRLQVTTGSSIVTAVNPVLALVGLGGILYNAPVTVDPLNVGIDVDVTQATAYLDRLDCPKSGVNQGNPTAYLSAKTGVATVSLGTYTGNPTPTTPLAAAKAPITALHVGPGCALFCLVPLGTLSFNVNVAGPVSTTVGDSTIRSLPLPVTDYTREDGVARSTPPLYTAKGIPPAAAVPANPQTVSSGGLLSSAVGTLIPSLTLTVDKDTSQDTGLLSVLSSILTSLTNTLAGSVTALLGTVLTGAGGPVDAVLDPLLQSLGIQVGKATAVMDAVTTGQPYVVTTALP